MKLIKRAQQNNNPFSLLDHLGNDLYPAFNHAYDAWMGDFRPHMDVEEEKTFYKVAVELPGVKKEDVQITMEDKTLSIRGEKKSSERKDDQKQHFNERYYGSFVRQLEFPVDIDADKIKATYNDGVLELNVPKAKSATPKQITIDVK